MQFRLTPAPIQAKGSLVKYRLGMGSMMKRLSDLTRSTKGLWVSDLISCMLTPDMVFSTSSFSSGISIRKSNS